MALFDICQLKKDPRPRDCWRTPHPKLMAHIPLNNITYRGMNGGAYADLSSGRVQAVFDNLPGSIGFIRNGHFRRLGVTTTPVTMCELRLLHPNSHLGLGGLRIMQACGAQEFSRRLMAHS
jgi:hypothetical protein